MKLPRASGVLLHPTSLPGRHGIGDLGPGARAFVDFLAETGQTWWQILPVGPTGYGNSPYQSPSSFAGNPLLISPEGLIESGWLAAEDLAAEPEFPADRVDFDSVAAVKNRMLRRAFERFKKGKKDPGFEAFVADQSDWLEDYVLFEAVKDHHGGKPWYEWAPSLVARDPKAMADWRRRLADGVAYHEFVQYAFEGQWQALRAACREKGLMLVGDMPIFVSQDSADVWAHPELYFLDEHGKPTVVAGVPPDYFSETGQLWGNPLYRWEAHAASGYAWWIARLRSLLERVDLVRIDHFRGFAGYWEVPAGSETAATGRWVTAPGRDFFEALRRELGSPPLIAEDLGLITPDVEQLRDEFELPGMRVLQFGFDADPASESSLPHRYIPHCVVYTGTHDNDTTYGWFWGTEVATTQSRREVEAARAFAKRYMNTDGREIHWDMIRLALSSVADTAIVPMQDLLGLDSRSRMNRPGRATGNWGWRFREERLDRRLRDRFADLTAIYGRWNGTVPADIDPRYRPEAEVDASAPARDLG